MDAERVVRTAVFVVALLLPACAMLSEERVPGWPELRIVEHYVPHAEMRDRCARFVAFGLSEACATFDLEARRCDLWFSADFPPQAFIVRHERLHCGGYDHAGEDSLKRLLVR